MIRNDRQYQVTRAEARRFREAIEHLRASPADDVEWRELDVSALEGQLETLEAELADYDALKRGEVGDFEVHTFGDVPQALIRARIAAGLTQRQLADALDLKEQQIQRYEASDYAGASLTRLQGIAEVLGLRVSNEALLPRGDNSLELLMRRLRHAGLDRQLVQRRLMPRDLPEEASVADLTATVARVLDVSPRELTDGAPLRPSLEAALAPNFKVPDTANEPRLVAYTLLARYLADLVIAATPHVKSQRLPPDWNRFREEVVTEQGAVGYDEVLSYLWSRGVAVLPLADPGAFHAAFWRIEGRDVIVLKQVTRSAARWLFDLLHESYHAAQSDSDCFVLEEPDEEDADLADDDELAANSFAGNVIFGGTADQLAQEAVNAAEGRLERLKRATVLVAKRHSVDPGALANYLAWRLSLQGEDWWGTANNLQSFDADPWERARDALLLQLDLPRLNHSDQELLGRALEEVD
jgi:transcriptional regulator with XRE-family HTH domain